MEVDFDWIVIGSGAGGATFARACAKAGKRVLILERGMPLESPSSGRDERRALLEKAPYDDRLIHVNDRALRLYMGGVPGGGTAMFGGAMLRPSQDDFLPGKHYPDRLDRVAWEWPVTYDELRTDYDEAERLFRVASDPRDRFDPLPPPTAVDGAEPLPLAPINERLMDRSRRDGLHPFRLPLAIDASRCERCAACAGFLCPTGARRSTAQIIAEPSAGPKIQLATGHEAETLDAGNRGRIAAVTTVDRLSGRRRRWTAAGFALAAGAIGSPAILLRSGLDGPHVGRHYMFHYSPIAVGIFPRPTGGAESFVKQVGIADYYFGTPDCPHKLGLAQSLPVPGPELLRKSGFRRWPRGALEFVRRRMLPFAGIVEDLPDPRNRVKLGEGGRIELRHEFSDFDRRRGAALGRAMCRVLRRAGAVYCGVKAFPSREHVAHQCGTLRMARRAEEGVVDPDGRMFRVPNLWVVDGSVLPTSLGVGPSLTIVALALRAARAALQSL